MNDVPNLNLSDITIPVVAGRPARAPGAPLNEPVVLSSTYVSTGAPRPDELLYARIDTETWHPFESVIGQLEHATEPGIVFGSGLAACAAALSLVRADLRIVVPRHAYQMALGLFDQTAERNGGEVVRVDIADTEQVIAALVGEDGRAADILWIESPTNPMLEVADLPALIAAARDRGILTCVDNTFATPLGQNPLDFGADVVVHSATKYLAGHSDVILGAAVTSDPDLAARLRAYRAQHGNGPGPFETWLALRGVRTLALRVEKSQANAAELARRLSERADVLQVRHPSLPGDPGHERAQSQMRGFGSVISLRPRGGAEAAQRLVESVQLWVPATSLGGVESTLERRRRFPTESVTVPEDLIRMSVGVEDVEDLWADLVQALESSVR